MDAAGERTALAQTGEREETIRSIRHRRFEIRGKMPASRLLRRGLVHGLGRFGARTIAVFLGVIF